MSSPPQSDGSPHAVQPESYQGGEIMFARARGQAAAEWQAELFDARLRHDPVTAFGVGALQEALWQRRIELAARYSLRDAPILDVGCGNGRVPRALAEHEGNHVVAIDVSAECVRSANKHNGHPNVTYQQASIECFSPTHQFGLVTMYEVLEHVDDPVAVLRRLSDWLLPGGRLIFSTPNRSSLNRVIKNLPLLRDIYRRRGTLAPDAITPGHVEEYHYDELHRMVQDAALEVEHTHGAILLLPFPDAIPTLARSPQFAHLNVRSGDWWPRRALHAYVVGRKPT